MFLRDIRESVQLSAAICSILTNSFLFLLIAYKSPNEIGNYKYMLQSVSLFEMLYGVLDIVASPITFTVGSIFMVIIPHNDKYFGRQGAMFLNTIYCFFFGFSMGMFVVIFAYRLMVSRGDRILLHFKGLKIISLFIFPLFYGFVWGLISLFPFAPTPEKDDFIRDEIREKLNLTLDEIAYTAPLYYSKTRRKVIISSVLSISVQWMLVALSLFLVGWFGLKCYSYIRRLLETQETRSPKLQELQNQLFLALVLQASIPIFLMHIPVIILYTFSLLSWEFDPITVCITISLFPALDPFPTIFVIRGYREACSEMLQQGLRWMCCLKPRTSFELRTVSIVL